jgi:hypothetical protein
MSEKSDQVIVYEIKYVKNHSISMKDEESRLVSSIYSNI